MTYYKIIQGNVVVGVGTSYELRKVQAKHNILVISTENDAQYIQVGESLYRDTWLAAVTSDRYGYEQAEIAAITEEEYAELKDEIDAGNMPAVPDTQEVADPEPGKPEEGEEELSPAKTRLRELEDQVAELAETNTFLQECLLEISEIIYA